LLEAGYSWLPSERSPHHAAVSGWTEAEGRELPSCTP
jgi:hypothetical protein